MDTHRTRGTAESTANNKARSSTAGSVKRPHGPVQVSIQAHPSPDFLTNYTPPGFSGLQPHMAESVCFQEVFSYAPPIAAQMTLDKILLVSSSV